MLLKSLFTFCHMCSLMWLVPVEVRRGFWESNLAPLFEQTVLSHLSSPFYSFTSPLSSRKHLWGLCVHLAVWKCRILQHFSSTVGNKGEKYGLVCPSFASVTKLQLSISPSRSFINSISTLIWPLKTKLNFKFKRKLKLLMKQLPGSG